MIVLAVYFHDMGMLVTKHEYNARDAEGGGFRDFVTKELYAGVDGEDYRARVSLLSPDERDRFLYQEFVRHEHAERIKAWVTGSASDKAGVTKVVANEIDTVLQPLGTQFRRDLGIVCESHHLNDLADTKKYKVSQPYGNSDSETVNLQYAAVLLRTADLLHITADRTPSVEFRTINPSDPVSQREWAKQMAVKRVRAKLGLDEEGQPCDEAEKDTIEVHAYFDREEGFFGLTSYLSYAAEQLRKSHEWISQTCKLRHARHEFPWRKLDDSNIETAGFIRETFEFTIDQAKILDLLTGHTLYNDTNVVLREVVQNAIDAIRLQFYSGSPRENGKVRINWNSESRYLSVQDNGTGMTQKIINDFLLRVGSSRYQDPDFRKQHPEFNSISRFGIGVLSTFMIADSVDVLTCHPEEELARRLILRSVHGRYLIRLVEKNSPEGQEVGPHGTIFRLHVRPSVDMRDIESIARQWIVVPECEVTLSIDQSAAIRVGYASVSDALRGFLRSTALDFAEVVESDADFETTQIRIVEREDRGVTLAYALRWNPWFREWAFLTVDEIPGTRTSERDLPSTRAVQLGICVEGIRIVPQTPGFENYPLVALANIKGKFAPRTNVARSGLEATPERDEALRVIYSHYSAHIADELNRLVGEGKFSLSWATSEATFLLAPLTDTARGRSKPLSPDFLRSAMQDIPCILTEKEGLRSAKSVRELQNENALWTIQSGLLRSAESLMREVASNASLFDLVKALKVDNLRFPSGDSIICAPESANTLVKSVFSTREVDKIVVDADHRRVDLRWAPKSGVPKWFRLPSEYEWLWEHFQDSRRTRANWFALYIPSDDVIFEVPVGTTAVRAFESVYLVSGTPIAGVAREVFESLLNTRSSENITIACFTLAVIGQFLIRGKPEKSYQEVVDQIASRFDALGRERLSLSSRVENMFDYDRFVSAVASTNWKLFDASAWSRRGEGWFE